MKKLFLALLIVAFLATPVFAIKITWTQPSTDTLKSWNFNYKIDSGDYKLLCNVPYTGQEVYEYTEVVGESGNLLTVQIEVLDQWDRPQKSAEATFTVPLPPLNTGLIPINIVISE